MYLTLEKEKVETEGQRGGAAYLVQGKAQHDQIRIFAIDRVPGCRVVAWLSTHAPDEVHYFVLTYTQHTRTDVLGVLCPSLVRLPSPPAAAPDGLQVRFASRWFPVALPRYGHGAEPLCDSSGRRVGSSSTGSSLNSRAGSCDWWRHQWHELCIQSSQAGL